MCIKFLLILVLLTLAVVAESANATPLTKSCANGQGCTGDDNELEPLMDSETNRRQLAARRRYIGYDALKYKNNVPCNRRGQSYYDCKKRKRANPYRRGCSTITHCYRYAS